MNTLAGLIRSVNGEVREREEDVNSVMWLYVWKANILDYILYRKFPFWEDFDGCRAYG